MPRVRLTPWNNDAVTDASGEAFYIRDEQTGRFWSPTPLPARGESPYVVRHGFGYSVFEHTQDGISSELWIYVSIHEPVKFAVLKLKNNSDRRRRLSTTGYWEWVLGELRAKGAMHVATEIDPQTSALFARNSYNTDFEGRVAFVASSELARSYTADRADFWDATARSRNPPRSGARAFREKPASASTRARHCRCKWNWNRDRNAKSLSFSARDKTRSTRATSHGDFKISARAAKNWKKSGRIGATR